MTNSPSPKPSPPPRNRPYPPHNRHRTRTPPLSSPPLHQRIPIHLISAPSPRPQTPHPHHHIRHADLPRLSLEAHQHPERFFQIKKDPSIRNTHPTKTGLPGTSLEIATPILRCSDWEWAVPEMCNAITAACVRVGAEVGFNSSTGLHVHVGVGREYTLAELKRIAKAVVVLEARMDLHHECRRLEPALKMGYIYPVRMSPGLRGLSDLEMVEKVDGQCSIADLLVTVNGGLYWPQEEARGYRYDFTAVRSYTTVEFRQAMGTCEGEWIVRWVADVVRFVTAVGTEDGRFAEWAGLLGGVADEEVLRRFGAWVEV